MQKRRAARTIQKAQDSLGNLHESPQGIIQSFARYFREKYAPIVVDARCIEVMVGVRPNSTGTYAEPMEQPITPEEILAALWKEGRNKAAASDGIGLQFYTTNWEVIQEDTSEILN